VVAQPPARAQVAVVEKVAVVAIRHLMSIQEERYAQLGPWQDWSSSRQHTSIGSLKHPHQAGPCTVSVGQDKSRRRTRQNLPDYIRYHRHQACQCSHRHSCCMCSQCLGQQHQCTHCQQRTDWCCTRQCHHSILFRCKYHLHRQCLGALT
jgi:hypothetical protein